MEDCSTDERLQQETLCRRQWTDEYVERPETLMRQNVVVVWLECLLVDVVHHTGPLAPDHVDNTLHRPYLTKRLKGWDIHMPPLTGKPGDQFTH